jgi:predicted MFS family arabinose efflux permease
METVVKNTLKTRRGRVALMVAHCAGMVDLVALPVWVGTLISRYGFDPQQAGGLVTLFLAGAVSASVLVAPRFHRLPRHLVAPLMFGLAALLFFACGKVSGFAPLAILHALAGLAVGTALSITHGTAGRTDNPHRLFGFMQSALGVFGVVFMATVPQIVQVLGGPALFVVFAVVMLGAFIVAAFGFPSDTPGGADQAEHSALPTGGWSKQVWYGVLGISCMALTQAMVFSFLERMGMERGFGADRVHGLLIALGLVNLIPGALAAFLQRRLDARKVVLAGAALQAVLAGVLALTTEFAPYAGAGALFVSVMIFTHVFAFGLLSVFDPTGRAVSATPAMLMLGGAIGPILGGTLVKFAGYPALGAAAVIVNVIAISLFARLLRSRSSTRAAAATVAR